MSTPPQPDSLETPPGAPSGAAGGPDEFLSMREILGMILRHWRAIGAFVLLVTAAAGIFFATRPRQYQAEGYLQVTPPVYQERRVDVREGRTEILQGRVDKDLFETLIASHLQKVSSAYIARNVADLLDKQGEKITPLELAGQVAVTRPPKTDLIRVVSTEPSAYKALLVVQLWIRESLASIQKNNIHAALSQTRVLLKQAQFDLMEKQTTAAIMKAQVAQSQPLITLSRGVDDRQLWGDLTRSASPDPEALKRLSAIHIKTQEPSEEYIKLKMALLGAEQRVSEITAWRDLYQDVERLLEAKIASAAPYPEKKPAATNAPSSEAVLYVALLLKSSDINQFGEPGLIPVARGTRKKTVLVFLASLGLACFVAFMGEWGKGLLSSR